MTNLIDNAIKYNLTGGHIQLSTTAAAGVPCFSISNTGPVVPPGDVGRLFEPFRQLNGERTGHDAGHGLGLAIVRSIALAHGAALSVRARPEGGLDITVSFHASPAQKSPV